MSRPPATNRIAARAKPAIAVKEEERRIVMPP
jgi:hypothetical protein